MTLRKYWVLLGLLAVSAAMAGPFSFVKVTDTNDNGGFLDDFAAPAYNDTGQVAFYGSYGLQPGSALWTATAPAYGPIGPLSLIADTTGSYSGFGTNHLTINSTGQVAFYADLDAGGNGVYLYDGVSSVGTVLDTSGSVGGHGGIWHLGNEPGLNDSGHVAYNVRFLNGEIGTYLDNGTVNELIYTAIAPDISNLGHQVALNNNGLVALKAVDGGTHTLVAATTSGYDRWANPQGGPYQFVQLDNQPAINDNNQVLFKGYESLITNPGLYIATDSGVTLVTQRPYIDSHYALNNQGTVLYLDNTGNNDNTLYMWKNGVETEVLKSGDLLEGHLVTNIRIGSYSLNNLDQLAFYAELDDGTHGVYVAGLSPVPEPASLLFLLLGGTWVGWRRRRSA